MRVIVREIVIGNIGLKPRLQVALIFFRNRIRIIFQMVQQINAPCGGIAAGRSRMEPC